MHSSNSYSSPHLHHVCTPRCCDSCYEYYEHPPWIFVFGSLAQALLDRIAPDEREGLLPCCSSPSPPSRWRSKQTGSAMDTGTSFDGVSMHVLLEIKKEVTQTQQQESVMCFGKKYLCYSKTLTSRWSIGFWDSMKNTATKVSCNTFCLINKT